jgi:hypothetical protein
MAGRSRATRPWLVRAGPACLVLLAAACLPAAAEGPWRATEANTPGWAAMTPAERVEYQRRMRALDSLAACRAFQAEHRARVRERTRQRLRGQPAPPDAETLCLQLQQAGQFR